MAAPRRRVCLVTTGQPSTNPRAVKEADALSEAGYDVRLIGAHWAPWADAADRRLLASRQWPAEVIDWRRESAPGLFWKSRIRHRAARACMALPGLSSMCLSSAVSRVTPELTKAASRVAAELFIAHNLGALPAAWTASRRCGALLGFDAEDFHSGEFPPDEQSRRRTAVERAERHYLPRCDYVTAASQGIAEAYATLSGSQPVVILNVFPLASRPPARRPTGAHGPLTIYWFSQTIGPSRGLEDAVRAMGLLDDGEVELHLRGVWQAGYREQLTRVATHAGVSRDRLVSHDPGDADEMVRLAAAFDVGLAIEPGTTPNSDILLSNKVFTYLLAGNAVVLTRTSGQQRLLPSIDRCAVACDAGDERALALLLKAWARDRHALEDARAASWEYGTRRYNWDSEKAIFLAQIDALFQETSRAARGSAA
ncbi:MAG: hypothetical protein AB7F99_02905 [Vicinamibacterales bacterium]